MGWRDWYRRMSDKKSADWEIYHLNQCLTLSLSGMEKNESLLIFASYFWSNTINAFIFGHGPMTPTLADVYYLTGLRITGALTPFDCLGTGSKRLGSIKDSTGWASYIQNYKEDTSSVNEKEYIAFMNMWLERFFFCRSFVGQHSIINIWLKN